jgi:hypothetical protein
MNRCQKFKIGLLLFPFVWAIVFNFIFFNPDGIIGLNNIYRITDGQFPYLDYQVVSGPIIDFIYYLLSLTKIEPILSIYLLSGIFNVLAALVNYKFIFKLTKSNSIALLSSFFSSVFFISVFSQIREDHIAILLIYYSFYLYFFNPNKFAYIAVGILFFLSLMSKVNYAIPGMVGFFIAYLYKEKHPLFFWKNAFFIYSFLSFLLACLIFSISLNIFNLHTIFYENFITTPLKLLGTVKKLDQVYFNLIFPLNFSFIKLFKDMMTDNNGLGRAIFIPFQFFIYYFYYMLIKDKICNKDFKIYSVFIVFSTLLIFGLAGRGRDSLLFWLYNVPVLFFYYKNLSVKNSFFLKFFIFYFLFLFVSIYSHKIYTYERFYLPEDKVLLSNEFTKFSKAEIYELRQFIKDRKIKNYAYFDSSLDILPLFTKKAPKQRFNIYAAHTSFPHPANKTMSYNFMNSLNNELISKKVDWFFVNTDKFYAHSIFKDYKNLSIEYRNYLISLIEKRKMEKFLIGVISIYKLH